jgi:putative flippase GtrA
MSARYQNLRSLYLSRQFLRFLLVGGAAAALHWLSRILFNWYVAYVWAIVLAYVVGVLVGFVLNRLYVFPYSDRPVRTQLTYFFLINLAVFPFVWLVAYVLGEWVLVRWLQRDVALALAHGIAIMVPVFANFAAHKFLTFRGS